MSNKVLKYPGGKGNIVGELVKLIPEHKTYLEPYFGAGTLFFTKEPSKIETINDIDGDIINLFLVIQKHPKELAARVLATPYSRDIYNNANKKNVLKSQDKNNIDRAMDLLIRCWMGFGNRGASCNVGFKTDVSGRESMYALWDWYKLPERVIETAERLRKVQIENRSAVQLIRAYNNEDTFMYLDPPYLFETRISGNQYTHEMTDKDHEELLDLILQSKANIMISGYDSELYNDKLCKWRKKTFSSCASMGKPRREVIWMNYDDNRQMTLEDFI